MDPLPADRTGPPQRPPKVLITKVGFDGHDRGSRIVAAYLRDAGMEVVYTGPWQTVASVVTIATQEDVDVIGISSLATDHLIVPRLMDALRQAGLGHVAVVVGGIVPDGEVALLTDAGVARVFHPGATREDIVGAIAALSAGARALTESQG
jgi:methylmalonyl-CoA mutase C-terminal domain/subunit